MYAAFDSTGEILVVAGRGGEVAFWSASKNELIGKRAGHRGASTRIVAEAESARVASLGEDGQVILWDTASGDVVQRIQLPAESHGVRDAVFHDAGQSLLTLDQTGFLRVWDTRRGNLRQEFRAHAVAGSVIAAHPSDNHVVTAGIDGSLRVWRIRQHFEETVLASDDGVTWSEFSADGRLFVTSHESGSSRVYDAETLQLQRERVTPRPCGGWPTKFGKAAARRSNAF